MKVPVVFLGKILPILSLLVISVLYSRKLSYDEYGKFQTVWVLANILGTIILFGLPSIIFATGKKTLQTFFKKYGTKIIAVYTVIVLAAFSFTFFSDKNFDVSFKFLVFGFIMLQAGCVVSDSFLIKHDLLRHYLIINSLYSLIFFSYHLYFYYYAFSLQALVFGITILAVLKLLFSIGMLCRRKSYAGVAHDLVPRAFFRNWLYTGINEVFGVVVKWLDKIFLLYLLTASEFAIFFNGSFELPLFAVLISAVESLMLTNISRNLPNKTDARIIFGESFKLLSLISFPIFFFFLFTHQETYAIIFDNKYNSSIPVFVITLFIIPLRISHYGVILQSYGKANKLALGSAIDFVLSLTLMFALFPVLGTKGVMLAIVLSTYLQVVYYLYESAKTLDITVWELLPFKYLGKLFASVGAGYLVLSSIRRFLTPTQFFVTMIVVTAAVVCVALYMYYSGFKKNNLEKKISI